MSITDRRSINGDPTALAIKWACRVATTGNIVLSGLQVTDTIALAEGDRVLVWQQTDPATNGIYNASSGVWSRTLDANSNDKLANGMLVAITDGAVFARGIFQLIAVDPIVLDTSALNFLAPANLGDSALRAYDFGVRGDGGDYTVQGQAAIDKAEATGRPLLWPNGTIRTRGWFYSTGTVGNGKGLQIEGAGSETTFFLYIGTAGGKVLTCTTDAVNEFEDGLRIARCQFNGAGISLRRISRGTIDDVVFAGINGDCIHVGGSDDTDSTFELLINNVRTLGCTGFGISGLFDASHTEFSNLHVTNCNFVACGDGSDNTPPTTGAIAWRGLICEIDNCGFTETYGGPAVYIAQSGTAQLLSIRATDFENTRSALYPAVYADTGIRGLHLENLQFLQGVAPLTCTGAVWLTNTASGVTFAGSITMRIYLASDNYVAFKSTSNTVALYAPPNIWWQLFDNPGQHRFVGFTFGPIPGECKFSISATDVARLDGVGYGFTMPMHLGGSDGTGEWIPYSVPSTGLSINIAGPLTPTTPYYFYLYNSALASTGIPVGSLTPPTTTAPATSLSGGFFTRVDDPTQLYIGTATTDGAGHFQPGGTQVSWYPPASAAGTHTVTRAQMVQGAALSVLGVAGNAIADENDIVAASDKQVMRRSGTAIGFGAIDVSSSAAVTGTLAVANGGTGAATFTQYGVMLGNGTAAFTQVLPTGGNSGLPYQSQGSALAGIFGQLGNTALVNSAVTIGSTSVSLGATAATIAGLTLTSPVINTADARGVWTAGATWTLPAHTLGGTVSGGGNQLNNVIIGSSTPLAGSFTTVFGSTSLTSPLHVGGSATGQALTLQSTTGVGSGDAINLALGNNGARTAMRVTQTGVGINTAANPSVDLAVGGIGGTNAGLEVSVSTNVAVQAYNRNTSAYAALTFDGTTVAFRPSGAAAILMPASGCLTVGSGANDNGAGNITCTQGIQPGTFTVGTLPTGVLGKIVNCSNARAYNGAGVQEGAGGGTGSLVSYNTTWKVVGTNQTAVA